MSRKLWVGLMAMLGGLVGALALQQTAAVQIQLSHAGFVVDGRDRSLYVFMSDTPNTSTCEGQCAQNWPPLLTTGKPTIGAGITERLVGTTTRRDGSMQVTYAGRPLYYFARDQTPGNANGQGVGGVWFLVQANGEPARTINPQAQPPTNPPPAQPPTNPPPAQPPASPPAAQPPANQANTTQLRTEGQTIFAQSCASCHGAEGQGGTGPRLAGHPQVQNPQHLVQVITQGIGYMPAVGANFSNRQLAAVITYVRTSFGNNFGAVSEQQVAQLRSGN